MKDKNTSDKVAIKASGVSKDKNSGKNDKSGAGSQKSNKDNKGSKGK